MKKFVFTRLLVSFTCMVCAGTAWLARAQFASGGVGKDFTYPFYWPATSGVARKKYVVTGQEFRPVTNGVFALTHARIESFREDGTSLVWTATSPACLVNINNGAAHGGTNVFFRSADDRLFLTGVGFLWQQNSSVLILSNKAFTWMDTKKLTNAPGAAADHSTNKMKTTLALSLMLTARLTAAEMEVPPARPGLKIWSGRQIVYLTNNFDLHTNNVIVIDPPVKPGDPETRLACEWATVKRGANSQIEEIAAHGKVAVDQGERHARGNFGLYTGTNEIVALVGAYDPADTNNIRPYLYRWSRTNSAPAVTNSGDSIIYSRRDSTLDILNSQLELPPAALKSPSPTNSARATNGPAKPPK